MSKKQENHDPVMDQLEQLMEMNNIKMEQMVLDSVTILLSAIVKGSSSHAKEIFGQSEVKELKVLLFNILQKYGKQRTGIQR